MSVYKYVFVEEWIRSWWRKEKGEERKERWTERMADMYKIARRESVYPPSEDSFAITDTVIRDFSSDELGGEEGSGRFKSIDAREIFRDDGRRETNEMLVSKQQRLSPPKDANLFNLMRGPFYSVLTIRI